MSVDPGGLRERLLEYPSRQDVVLGAISTYNKHMARVRDWLQKKPGQELQVIRRGSRTLEQHIEENRNNLDSAPANLAAREVLEAKRSGKLFLDNILGQMEQGIPLGTVTEAIPEPSKVSDYGKLIGMLRQKGVVVDVDDRKAVGRAIREAADYQVVLLDRQFEIPAPFSQNLLKNPRMENGNAFKMYLWHLVEAEIKKVYGVDLDTVFADRRDKAHARARGHARSLARSNKFRSAADNIVADLMAFEPAYLLPFEKTREGFEDAKSTPEEFFARMAARISPEKNYLTITWRGFDVHHPKIMLTTNNSAGMRIHVYSQFLQGLAAHGYEVDKADMTSISKLYAHGAEGHVLSRSGSRNWYDPVISHVADHSRPVPRQLYSEWVDLDGNCHCLDSRYMGRLHMKSRYDFAYFCMHLVALSCAYREQAMKGNKSVLSPFIFPLDDQLWFERQVAGHVLVSRKEDGAVKTANRGEREWLNMVNLSETGYERNYTVDIAAAKEAMHRMCIRG
ncbi:MAG: hypothetical protein KKD17_00620 [Nanoarchaeota archaeon]|nr:hypothetical protein [Nanoarchaeota archaeon]